MQVWSAGMDPDQRPCLHKEYVPHMAAFLGSRHMLPPLTSVSSFLSLQAEKKAHWGLPVTLTQAAVYDCWFCQEPWKLLTPERMVHERKIESF